MKLRQRLNLLEGKLFKVRDENKKKEFDGQNRIKLQNKKDAENYYASEIEQIKAELQVEIEAANKTNQGLCFVVFKDILIAQKYQNQNFFISNATLLPEDLS